MQKQIKVFEAFAGYGSQALALKRLQSHYPDEVSFEYVGISEIEPYAIKAYKLLHGNVKNYGDICKINWDEVPDFDLLTYSFPCTDISTAGVQKGMDEGSGTRSSLLWECRKTITSKKPKYLLMENVKSLVSAKYIDTFKIWIKFLEEQGYTNYYKILNSNQYGIPQHRERVFMISILNDDEGFEFPKPIPLKKTLTDILEFNPELKYYITGELPQYTGIQFKPINTSASGLCSRTIKSCYCNTGVANLTRDHGFGATGVIQNGRLRKLSARECFRLMGLAEPDIDILVNMGAAKTNLYKLAGNSIVIDTLYYIFYQMFISKK